MAKTTKKRSARSKKSPARRQRRTGSQRNAASTVGKRSGTKQARAIEMLRSKEGTSIAALMEATGWQQHSVRGFLAGVIRKRLKMNLVSAVDGSVRTYRITGERFAPPSKAEGAQSKPA